MVEPLFDLNQVGFLKSVQAFSSHPKLVWVYFAPKMRSENVSC